MCSPIEYRATTVFVINIQYGAIVLRLFKARLFFSCTNVLDVINKYIVWY